MYQSFAEGEVDAKTAHEIGVKLAKELFEDRFEVVVATHLNTKHFHNHFVINAVSFVDRIGKFLYYPRFSYGIQKKTPAEIQTPLRNGPRTR